MNAPFRQSMAADEVSDSPLLIDADRYANLANSGVLDDWGRIELRGGTIVRMNSEYAPHMLAKTEIGFALRMAVTAAGLPLYVGIDGSLRLSRLDVPDPDVIVFEGPPERGFVDAAKARLVVEVADSSLAKDLGIKEPLYARHAIPEFWLADINARIMYRMTEPALAGYGVRSVFRCGERIESLTIPLLAIDLPEF